MRCNNFLFHFRDECGLSRPLSSSSLDPPSLEIKAPREEWKGTKSRTENCGAERRLRVSLGQKVHNCIFDVKTIAYRYFLHTLVLISTKVRVMLYAIHVSEKSVSIFKTLQSNPQNDFSFFLKLNLPLQYLLSKMNKEMIYFSYVCKGRMGTSLEISRISFY